MKMNLALIIAGFQLSCWKTENAPLPVPVTPVIEVGSNTLAKGVNLSNWFNDYSDPGQYSTRFTVATLKLIREKGFTYVRIPIGATILFDPSNPSELKVANRILVDSAIRRCIEAGLGVTINLHPWKNDTDSLLSNDAAYVQKMTRYWNAVATYFKKYDTSKIFFEVYNEPHAAAARLTSKDASWWVPVQAAMIGAIREATADHTIIAGGEGWNSINGLTQLQPYNYQNLVYNFHFYDPFLFTHQGASWAGWKPALLAANVPYPSSPSALSSLVASATDTELKNTLRWYGDARYNIDSLDVWVKKAYSWSQKYGVRIIVNEFGSYKPFAPLQSRLNWLHDCRITFDKYGIGWALWEADEGFGWITYTGGNRNHPVADQAMLLALGLQ